MRLSTIMLLIIPLVVLLGSYVFLPLNQQIVSIDFLFLDIDIKAGVLVVFSFLFGTFIAFALELLNFFRVKDKNKENK